MIAKGAESRGAVEASARPEHIPEKFWDAEKGEVRVEDLAKSYSELEKVKSGKKPDEAPKMGDDGKPVPDGEKPKDESKPDGEFDLTAHREKMSEKLAAGEAFGDEDYAPFEKMGFKREDIDTIAQALAASATISASEVFAIAGGEDKYAAMIEWGKANYTPAEIEAFDASLGATPAQREAAIKGLQARFQIAVGTDGERDVTARNQGGGADARFESKAEMVAAMQDARYAKDSAYRAEVARKLENSHKAGVNILY
jgi:hypothetical protein